MNDRKYAELVIKEALGIKEGAILVIKALTEQLDFARLLTKMAYEEGASEVMVQLTDPILNRLNYECMSEERLAYHGQYKLEEAVDYAERGCCYISITGGDPKLLEGIDPKRIQLRDKSVGLVMKPVMKYTMNNINSWVVVGYPTLGWARQVFPNESDDVAMSKLREAIYKAVRLDHEDPVKAWEEHLSGLQSRAKILNDSKLDHLHYRSSKGTDLVVGLPKGHIWMGAVSQNAKGMRFLPNMPTEEIFSAPDRNRVDGIVYSTKPLNLNGSLIEEFWIRFEKGKAISCGAKSGQEILQQLIDTDEGSSHLGEVALVSVESPINRSELIFMNTLYDENASCHFALGAAYPTCLKGGVEMDDEQLLLHGMNRSQRHVDFMVGDESLEVVGITESGEEILIMKDGDFVI